MSRYSDSLRVINKYVDKRALRQVIDRFKNFFNMVSFTIPTNSLIINSKFTLMFTGYWYGVDTTTPLALTYNGTSYPVKAYKNSNYIDITAREYSTDYVYLKDATLDMIFTGTEFRIIDNPIIYKSDDLLIYADGKTVTVSTTDLASGATLATGDMYIVREA